MTRPAINPQNVPVSAALTVDVSGIFLGRCFSRLVKKSDIKVDGLVLTET